MHLLVHINNYLTNSVDQILSTETDGFSIFHLFININNWLIGMAAILLEKTIVFLYFILFMYKRIN
jgi:hypothetical protein